MKINGITFLEFCSELKGYRVLGTDGIEIAKYELFHKGINPRKIMTMKNKFIIVKKIKC